MIYGNKLGKLFDRHVILIFADAIIDNKTVNPADVLE